MSGQLQYETINDAGCGRCGAVHAGAFARNDFAAAGAQDSISHCCLKRRHPERSADFDVIVRRQAERLPYNGCKASNGSRKQWDETSLRDDIAIRRVSFVAFRQSGPQLAKRQKLAGIG